MALGTDLAIKNWKPRGRQAMPCGGRDGLYVRSDTAGRKAFYWRKGSFYKLGDYPALSLSQARAMVAVCNEQARQGIEAAAIVASLRQSSSITDAAEKDAVTIRSAPRSLLRSRKKGTIESYEDAFEAYYEAYAASNLQVGPSRNAPLQWHRNVPVSLKAMPIRDITRSDIFPWMLKLLQTKHETGRKLRGLMDRVFEFAINLGVVNSNPVPPRRAFEVKRPKTRHHATIRPEELPKMWQHISQSGAGGTMKLLLKLAILSGHRVDVNRLARWDHIGLDSRQWTVPERVDKETEGLMKSGRVPRQHSIDRLAA